ncbi:hypothetical protein E1200_06120 [Actinomadura sp. GC306]|uniref:hypothetical protein n=1 Tax=Actinomadura sp. GC306 TaxID=2530367 RepID=UPI00104B70F6|nr:hypothetical protein [Actinomadura sp. GC306]TDC70163.1 hypothetical protein E1200_06120 [Actinomadura sp. GC306]
MSDHRRAGDLDRRTAERILGGAGDHARLQDLLAAASAPARPGELAGEDAAVAAFKAARPPARTSRRAAVRRFLTVKALVLVGGSLILTGGAAAYAAMNGHFPGHDRVPSSPPTLTGRPSYGGQSDSSRYIPPRSGRPATVPPSTPPATSKRRSAPPSPSADPGRGTAPGQQKKTAPPRGPGDNNGSPPGENSGNGQSSGNNGSSPGQNSGNGNGKPA